MSDSARVVAELCADPNSLLGPAAVVIGDGVGLARGYLPRVREALEREPELFRLPVLPAALGADSPLHGAAFCRDTQPS